MSTVLDTKTSTRLATTLTYLGAGPAAIADLQNRLDEITGKDNRIVVGEIQTDKNGMPSCSLEFDCASYDPPEEGRVDPRAVKDLKQILDSINFDGCVGYGAMLYLTD